MKTRILVVALTATLAPAFALAQVASVVAPATQAAATVQRDADRADYDAHCVRETGTRIRTRVQSPGAHCQAVGPGRAYTRDDLDRTGEINIADALRRLDPAIR